MKATTLIILGQEFIGAKDGDTYYLAIPEVEKALGYRSNSAREKLVSKSLESFAGKALTLGKTKIAHNRTRYSAINTEDFMMLVKWEAKVNHNEKALDFLTVMADENIRRRIDIALGEEVLESEYEEQTKKLYQRLRDEARINFRPKFTDWLKSDAEASGAEVNYPKEVNRLKKAGGILISAKVENMNLEQMMRWASIESRYDILRQADIEHTDALIAIQASALKDTPVFDF